MTAPTIISVLFLATLWALISLACRRDDRRKVKAAERESAEMDQAVAIVSGHAADFAAWEADMVSKERGAGH